MSNQISASRALTTFKTLNNSLPTQISNAKFSFVKKGDKNADNGKSVKDSTDEVNKNFKSVQDKLDEMFKLRQGLNSVNFITMIKVNGKEMSILDALSYKHHIIPHKKTLLESLKKDQRKINEQYRLEVQSYERRLNESKDNDALISAIKLDEPFIYDVSEKIESLQKEIEAFELDFDIYLNEVNPGIKFDI